MLEDIATTWHTHRNVCLIDQLFVFFKANAHYDRIRNGGDPDKKDLGYKLARKLVFK